MSAQVDKRLAGTKRKVPHKAQTSDQAKRNQVANRLAEAFRPNSPFFLGKTYRGTNEFQGAEPAKRYESAWPGDEGQDGAELSYAGSADDTDESDQERATTERDWMLAEARKARLDQEKEVLPVPEDVAAISQATCQAIRRVWTVGREEEVEKSIAKANGDIRRLNQDNRRDKNAFTIPGDKILTHIELFRQYIITWYSLKETGPLKKRQAAAKTLAGLLINILPELASCGLSYKSVAAEAVREILGEVLTDAELKRAAAAKLQRYLDQDYTLPSSYQSSIAISAKDAISDYFKHVEAGQNKEAQLKTMEVEAINERLEKSNQAVGFKKDDHLLPAKYLHQMLDTKGLENEQQRAGVTEKMRAEFAYILFSIGYQDLGYGIASLDQARAQTLHPTIQTEIDSDIYGYNYPLNDPPEKHGKPPFFSASVRQEKRTQGQARPSLSNHSPSVRRDTSTKQSDITDGIPGPYITADGKTQWGQVVHVQRVGPVGHRVMFNRGSDKHPIFEMRPGSCLPKGMAAKLATRFKMEKNTSREAWEIKLVTDIVELVGGRITRFRVRWRQAPWISFPTRTELTTIVGKAMVDGPGGYSERLKAKKKKIEDWLEICQFRGWHPDYRPPNTKPASQMAKASLPWLFGAPDSDGDGEDGDDSDDSDFDSDSDSDSDSDDGDGDEQEDVPKVHNTNKDDEHEHEEEEAGNRKRKGKKIRGTQSDQAYSGSAMDTASN